MESFQAEPTGVQPASQGAVSVAQADCLLTIGSQHIAAILADESATGLHVLIQGSPLFWVEDVGTIQTTEVEIAVRVSNIVHLETGENESASSIPTFRIGLERVGQPAVKKSVQPAPVPRGEARFQHVSRRPVGRIRLSVGGLIAFALITTPLVVGFAAWREHVHQAKPVETQSTAVASSATIANGLEPTKPTVPEPTPEIVRLPGVEPFLNPDVARKLELTPSQMGIFRQLNKTAQDALKDLEKYWESDGRLELAQRRNVLLETARQEALQVLTDQQRQTWDAMAR